MYDLAAYADATKPTSSPTTSPSLLSLTAAAAPSLTPVTLNPTADTYTESGSPTTNFGSSGEMRVKRSSGTTANREALLKFDLSSLGGAPASSAVLRLYGKLQDTRESNIVTEVFPTSTSWTESKVTWNTRPAATGAKIGNLTVKNTTAQYYDVDVTPFIQSELAAGRTTIALLLANPNTSSPYTTFNSRNASANKPQLVITPGPASNSAPLANAGVDQAFALPAAATLSGTVTDDGLPSGTVATSWTKFSGPGNVTFGNASLLSTTASFSAPGTYVLRLTANDGQLVGTDDVTIVVSPAGAQTATLNPTADSYVESGVPTTNFGSSAEIRVKQTAGTSVNREGLLKFDLSALPGSVTSVKLRLFGSLQDTRESNVVTQVFATTTGWTESGVNWNNRPSPTGASLGSITVQNATGKYYEVDLTAFVQAERAAGRNVIALLLKNPNVSTPFSTFASRDASTNKPQLVVLSSTAPDNQPPVVSAGPDQSVTISAGASLSGNTSDDGLPTATLTTIWSVVSGPGAVVFGDASQPATPVMFSAPGTYVLRLTSSDGLLSSSDDLIVTVNPDAPINATPVVNAGADVTITSPAAAASLDATVTDDGLPSTGTLVTTWSFVSGPGKVTFDNAANVDTTATFSQPGTYVLRLTANDGSLSASDDVTVTVNSPASGQSPFGDTPVSAPGTIELENFDEGGEGVAYHDTTSNNITGAYRNTGVDIEPTTDSGGGYNVGNVKAGEWLEYTVNVTTAGSYTLLLRAATDTGGGTVHVEFNGIDKTGPMTIGNTGGWQNWATIQKTGIALQPGQYVVRLSVDASTWGGDVANLNWMKLQVPPAADPWPNSWQTVQSSPVTRFEASSHSIGGKVYVFGGFVDSGFHVTKRVDMYDPATNTWTRKGDLPAGMAETHLGVTDDGTYIYFAGGFAGDLDTTKSPTQTAMGTVWRYNPADDSWLQLPSMTLNGQPIVRGAGGLAYVDGKLHYFGGNPADRVTNLADHIVLDLTSGATQWTNAAPMPDPKDHFSTVVLNGKIYAMGGEHGHDQLHAQQSDVHVYDPATDTWTQLASMPIAKSHMESGTFVYNGRIVFAGGQVDNFNSTTNVIEYDPASDQWITLAPLPVQRQGAFVGVIGNRVVMTLGAVSTNSPLSTTYVGLLPLPLASLGAATSDASQQLKLPVGADAMNDDILDRVV